MSKKSQKNNRRRSKRTARSSEGSNAGVLLGALGLGRGSSEALDLLLCIQPVSAAIGELLAEMSGRSLAELDGLGLELDRGTGVPELLAEPCLADGRFLSVSAAGCLGLFGCCFGTF